MNVLITALPYAIGGAALATLVGLYVTDRSDADEHDLSDYFEQAPEQSWAAVAEKLDQADVEGVAAVTCGLRNREVFAELEPEPADLVFLGPYDPVPPPRKNWPVIDREVVRPVEARTAPVELAAWSVPWRPPYADLVHASVVRRYGDSAEDIAARWLREAGEQARAGLAVAR